MKLNDVISSARKLFQGKNTTGQSFLSWFQGDYPSLDHRELLNEYRNMVYACISVITDEVGQYDPYIEQEGTEKKIKNHRFLSLLENPKTMSQFELFSSTQAYIELTGEAFWYLEIGEQTGFPKSIDLMRPDRVRVVIEKDGSVGGYALKLDDGREIPLSTEEVIHFKKFNPLNPYRGLGTLQAGLLYVDTENATALFQRNFLKNQASPSGILTLKGTMTKEAFNKVKTLWREQQAGEMNAGKTLFIRETDAKFEKIGLSIAELELADMKNINEERVLIMFRVPRPLLGQTDSNGLGRANIETIEYTFAKRTIEPKLVLIDDTLTRALKKYYKDNTLEIHHESQIPADDSKKLLEDEKGVDKWLTRNEIRLSRGLLPIEGGDKLYINSTDIPIESKTTQKSLGKIIKKMEVIEKQEKNSLSGDILREETIGEGKYLKEMIKLLNDQEKRIKQNLKAEFKKDIDTIYFDEKEEAISMTVELRELIEALIMATGGLTFDSLGEPSADFVLTQAARDAVFNSTERLMRSFNEETVLKIQKQIAMGLENKENLTQLTKRIESVFGEAKGYRAERIASTEAHRFANAGQVEAYRQNGIRKIKLVNRGADPCEFCKALNGKVVEIGQPFLAEGGSLTGVDGGTFVNDYADVLYADVHPNCHCTLEAVVEKGIKPSIQKTIETSSEEEKQIEKKLLTMLIDES